MFHGCCWPYLKHNEGRHAACGPPIGASRKWVYLPSILAWSKFQDQPIREMWIQDLQRVKSDREKGGQEKKSLRLAPQTLPSRKFSSHLPGREDARKISAVLSKRYRYTPPPCTVRPCSDICDTYACWDHISEFGSPPTYPVIKLGYSPHKKERTKERNCNLIILRRNARYQNEMYIELKSRLQTWLAKAGRPAHKDRKVFALVIRYCPHPPSLLTKKTSVRSTFCLIYFV